MSTETDNNVEPEAPKVAASELASKAASVKAAAPVGVEVPDVPLDTLTYSNTNFFYPFLRQTYNVQLADPQATGWGSLNNGGLVFQNGQYNSRREGYGA